MRFGILLAASRKHKPWPLDLGLWTPPEAGKLGLWTKKRSAFTLIELLTVIAIIVIIAALLLPAINGGFARANTVKCLSNLRQWNTAMTLYMAEPENGGIFPSQGSTATAPGGSYTADPRPGFTTNAWFNVLPPLVGSRPMSNLYNSAEMPRPLMKSIFICPAAKKEAAIPDSNTRTYYSSYSQNQWLEAANRGCQSSSPSTSGIGDTRQLRLSQIREPSVFAIMAEGPSGIGQNTRPGYVYGHTHPEFMGYPTSGDAFRHGGKANVAFADGHAGTFAKETIYTNTMVTDANGDYWNYGGIQWNPDNTNLYGKCN